MKRVPYGFRDEIFFQGYKLCTIATSLQKSDEPKQLPVSYVISFSFHRHRPTLRAEEFEHLIDLVEAKRGLALFNSRTKRSPTPAFSERSTCVSLYFLRISFTYCSMIVHACILHRLLEVPHSEYVPQMPFSGTRPKDMYQFCLFWVHIQGISLCTAHSEKVIIYLISGKYKE